MHSSNDYPHDAATHSFIRDLKRNESSTIIKGKADRIRKEDVLPNAL